jgi:hypothetical protein
MLLHILFYIKPALWLQRKRESTPTERTTRTANLLHTCRPLAWKGSSAQHHNKKSLLNKNCKVSPYFDNKRVGGNCLMTWSQFAMVM